MRKRHIDSIKRAGERVVLFGLRVSSELCAAIRAREFYRLQNESLERQLEDARRAVMAAEREAQAAHERERAALSDRERATSRLREIVGALLRRQPTGMGMRLHSLVRSAHAFLGEVE